jgi:Domain of unknown function (DUF4440)
MLKLLLRIMLCLSAFTIAPLAQDSKWAAPDDPVAKYIIESERKWAESACTQNGIEAEILADDFQGTSPRDGSRYDKAHAMASYDPKNVATDCRLLDAKVRFFGGNIAMVYGSETATRKNTDGKPEPRCLTWTDTWLQRNGKWQVIGAQDAYFPCK